MAPNPTCSAVARAKEKSGKPSAEKRGDDFDFDVSIGLSYAQIAGKIGQSEQHVIDGTFSSGSKNLCSLCVIAVCAGKVTPTTSEFNALASALGISTSEVRKPIYCLWRFLLPNPCGLGPSRRLPSDAIIAIMTAYHKRRADKTPCCTIYMCFRIKKDDVVLHTIIFGHRLLILLPRHTARWPCILTSRDRVHIIPSQITKKWRSYSVRTKATQKPEPKDIHESSIATIRITPKKDSSGK